jgi:hypothetical protein
MRPFAAKVAYFISNAGRTRWVITGLTNAKESEHVRRILSIYLG